MRRLSPFLLVTLCLIFFLHSAEGIQFLLRHGEETCISEDVLGGELLIGDLSVNPPDGRVAVLVTDPNGNSIYSKSVQSEGKFAHTASKPGEYRMCFHNNEGVSQKTIALTISSGGRDYKEMAKKDNLKPLELELKRLEDQIVQIHQEMKFLQQREIQMRETNGQKRARKIHSQTIGCQCQKHGYFGSNPHSLVIDRSVYLVVSHSHILWLHIMLLCTLLLPFFLFVRFDLYSCDMVQCSLNDRIGHLEWWTNSLFEEVLSRKEAHSMSGT